MTLIVSKSMGLKYDKASWSVDFALAANLMQPYSSVMYTNGVKKRVTKEKEKKKHIVEKGFISTWSVAAMDINVQSKKDLSLREVWQQWIAICSALQCHFILILPKTILDSNSASLNQFSNLNCIEVFR